MTNRERLLAILDHRACDRIPWIPRLWLWYTARTLTNTMPAQWRGMSLRELEHALGVGTPARDGAIFTKTCDGLEIIEQDENGNRITEERSAEFRWLPTKSPPKGKRITEYHTPVGMVRSVMVYANELDAQIVGGRMEEFPLKGPADYRVWEWIMQHTRWQPAYEKYTAYDATIGDDGLPMVYTGDVPFHEFALHLAGYNQAFLQLADYPKEVEHLLKTMEQVQRERLWPIMAQSPARLLAHGAHFSTQFTPPAILRKYILPYYQQLMPLLHRHGKSVALHADNDTSQIMELLEDAGFDMVECFVTAPMVPATIAQARRTWGNRVIIFGGLPSLLLSPSYPEEQFYAYMKELLSAVAPGDAFILGVADNVMPDSLIERVQWVSDFMQEHGTYPL